MESVWALLIEHGRSVMPIFTHSAIAPVSQSVAYSWFSAPGAFIRIMPNWEKLKIVKITDSLSVGARYEFRFKLGPFSPLWIAEIIKQDSNKMFCDKMIKGPFSFWEHHHIFNPVSSQKKVELIDKVEWKLPLHKLSYIFGKTIVNNRMKKMFKHRTRIFNADISRHESFSNENRKKILISGSNGLIGQQLCAFLSTGGHEVVPLLRQESAMPAWCNDYVLWDPQTGKILHGDLEGFDAVIHLAGAGIGDKRWSKKRMQLILDSRIGPTEKLCKLISEVSDPPEVLVSASAIGWYGNRGPEELNETSPRGTGFLSEVCLEWENATKIARDSGIRVVNIRSGIVLSGSGGALEKMLFPTKMGSSGPIAGGKQMMSWISLDDEIYAIHHIIMNKKIQGVVNLTAPESLTQKKFIRKLGKVLWRPTFLPLPGFMIKLLFGKMGIALIAEGQNVHPQKLIENGFEFEHRNLENCLRDCLGKWKND